MNFAQICFFFARGSPELGARKNGNLLYHKSRGANAYAPRIKNKIDASARVLYNLV